uniref:Follistatin-like domain-containing protein n=1 Tax=Acrobeloides nanus TaxID=290746 RepID=A0A914E0R0_9BILA
MYKILVAILSAVALIDAVPYTTPRPLRTCATVHCQDRYVCIMENNQAKCVPYSTQTCDEVLCSPGYHCLMRHGQPTCFITMSNNCDSKICPDGKVCREQQCFSPPCNSVCVDPGHGRLHFVAIADTCTANETFETCGESSEKSCEQPLLTSYNDKCNVNRCPCKDGFFRKGGADGQCVSREQCKRACDSNEEWKECSSCEGNCSQPNPICPSRCLPPKCQCKDGYVRHLSTRKCVLPHSNQC